MFSPALSSTSRFHSQSGSATNFLKHISQNTILLQSGILFWHNMKIRLWKFWLHCCFFIHFQNAHSVPKHGAVTQVQAGRNYDPTGAEQELFRAMGRQPLCSSTSREEKVGARLCWPWHRQHRAPVSPSTRLVSGLPSTSSWQSLLEAWPTLRLEPQRETRGMAPLAPETALNLLCWKAHNHFPWKNRRLCQFACTLLRLRTIRCFQSVALQ